MQILCKEDMSRLEEILGDFLGGEQHKCSFVRSSEFVHLRLTALYKPVGADPLVVYGEGLKIVLDSEKFITVSLLQAGIEQDMGLGKRQCHDEEEDEA